MKLVEIKIQISEHKNIDLCDSDLDQIAAMIRCTDFRGIIKGRLPFPLSEGVEITIEKKGIVT